MALIHAALTDGDYGMDITDADGHTIRLDIPVAQGDSVRVYVPCKPYSLP